MQIQQLKIAHSSKLYSYMWPVGGRSVFRQEAVLNETNSQFATLSFDHSASASHLCRVENQELFFVRLLRSMSNGVRFINNQERVNYISPVVEKPRIGLFPKEKKRFQTSAYCKRASFGRFFLRKGSGRNLPRRLNSSDDQHTELFWQATEKIIYPTEEWREFFFLVNG